MSDKAVSHKRPSLMARLDLRVLAPFLEFVGSELVA